jgi:hypothetical protein
LAAVSRPAGGQLLAPVRGLALLAHRFLQLHQTFERLGQTDFALRWNPVLALLHALVALPQHQHHTPRIVEAVGPVKLPSPTHGEVRLTRCRKGR